MIADAFRAIEFGRFLSQSVAISIQRSPIFHNQTEMQRSCLVVESRQIFIGQSIVCDRNKNRLTSIPYTLHFHKT